MTNKCDSSPVLAGNVQEHSRYAVPTYGAASSFGPEPFSKYPEDVAVKYTPVKTGSLRNLAAEAAF
jgi:hypothetical protein